MTTPYGALSVDTDGPAPIYAQGMPGYQAPTSTSWGINSMTWDGPCDCGSGRTIRWTQTLGLAPRPLTECPVCAPTEGVSP